MKFSSTAALAACVASALAEVKLTNSDYTGIGEGKPFKITWAGAEGPVKIVVATGESKDLKVVATIDSNDSGNSFVWTPEKGSLPSGTYALEISDSKTTNYSPQFQFSGTGTASTASSSASITSSASTSSSTSSSSSTITSSYSNSTTSSATKTSSSKTSSTASSTTTGSTVKPTINNNDSPRAQSSLAFVLVTVAGLMYLS